MNSQTFDASETFFPFQRNVFNLTEQLNGRIFSHFFNTTIYFCVFE